MLHSPKFLPVLMGALGLLGSRAPMPLPAEGEKFRRAVLADAALRPAERLDQYAKYNFGPLLTHAPASSVVGFIGPDYQRLRVKILAATQSAADPALYRVTGKTLVLGAVRSFSGTLRLQQVREAKPVVLHNPEEGPMPDVAVAGLAVGACELAENGALDRTGTFRGVVATYWYLDHRHRLHYDDVEQVSDSYHNNQFAGTWTSYATNKALRCNWGDYRVPNAGDLDVGAGEFSPAAKYESKGWQGYEAARDPENAAARKQEERAWWQ